MKVELWPIDRPKPYGRNPRIISDKSVEKVLASIKEFGFRQPLVCDGKDVIIIGHKRLMAAKKLGMTQIPVSVADDLPPAKVKALRIADNRTADEGEWNAGALGDELSDLRELGITLDWTGFDPEELDELLSLNDAALDDDDDDDAPGAEVASESEMVVVSRPGDNWRLGPHVLTVGKTADRNLDLTIKRWQHYTGEAAKLGGKSFRDVERDRAHDAPVGPKTTPAAGLAAKPPSSPGRTPRRT